MVDLNQEVLDVLKYIDCFLIGLTVAMFIIFIIIYGLISIVLDLNKKIKELEGSINNQDEWLEQVRKINLKKRSHEKLVLPQRVPKNKI